MPTLDDDEVWSVCKLGYQLYVRERYDEAAKIFNGLVSLDDSLGYPWHALGLIARKQGDVQRAVDCFRKRLDLEPDASETRLSLAETLDRHGYREDAADVLAHFSRHADDESPAAIRGRALLERWTTG